MKAFSCCNIPKKCSTFSHSRANRAYETLAVRAELCIEDRAAVVRQRCDLLTTVDIPDARIRVAVRVRGHNSVAVRSLMASRTEWTGTASNLLGALSEEVGDRIVKAKAWPASARALSGRIRRAATFLRKVGIDIAFDREGRARTRTIRISCVPEYAETELSAPSAPSADQGARAWGNG